MFNFAVNLYLVLLFAIFLKVAAQPGCQYQNMVGSNSSAVLSCSDIGSLLPYQVCTLKQVSIWGSGTYLRITGIQQTYNCTTITGKQTPVVGQICGTTKVDPADGYCAYNTYPYTKIDTFFFGSPISMLTLYEDGGFTCAVGTSTTLYVTIATDPGFSYTAFATYFDSSSRLVSYQPYECPITW
jgi:hypothetical protein